MKVKTAELLDEAARSGTLTAEEHRWRHTHLARAETVESLEVLVEDLLSPEPRQEDKGVTLRTSSQMTMMAERTFMLADLGKRTDLVTIMGSTRVDLKGLKPGEPLTIEVVTIMGETTVEVPAGVLVKVEATPVMGDCSIDPALRSSEASVRITGVVLMGSLRVIRSKSLLR